MVQLASMVAQCTWSFGRLEDPPEQLQRSELQYVRPYDLAIFIGSGPAQTVLPVQPQIVRGV